MKKQLQRFVLLVTVGLSLGGCAVAPPTQLSHVLNSGHQAAIIPITQKKVALNRQLKPLFKPQKVALLLPLSGPLSSAGHAVLRGFLANYYAEEASSSANATSIKPALDIIDTHPLGAEKALRQAVQDGVNLIVGPLSRQSVQAVINLPHNNIPWLTLNYFQTDFSDNTVYQFGFSAEGETANIAQQAWAAEYRHPLIITGRSALGQRITKQFDQTWQQLGGRVAGQISVVPKENENKAVARALLVDESKDRATALRKLLLRQMDFTVRRRQDIDMVFIQASSAQARQIRPALKFYFAGKLPVLSLSGIYNGRPQLYKNKDLEGVYFTAAPWQLQKPPFLNAIKQAWPDSTNVNLNNLYAMGADVVHLYPYLPALAQTPNVALSGYTGLLYMENNQEIHRQLQWATFRKGKIVEQALPAIVASSGAVQ